MQVNRASAAMRTGSVRSDAASVAPRTRVSGVAPAGATENDLTDHRPPMPYPHVLSEAEDAPERLLDAIDPKMVYAAAASLLRREGMVGLLLNRNA